MSELVVGYRAEPTLARFHASGAFVRGVMGPIGSGKSSAMCVELLRRAGGQRPGPDNARRTRFAVVRNTYPELRSTTMKTWADWAPSQVCRLRSGPPMSARMEAPLTDGTRLDMEVLFLALDSPADARKLLSLELTGAWINEAREVDKAVLDALLGRLGRYPPKRLGGPSWSGLVMDTNPPDDGHWWHRLAEETRPQGWEFFRQPPAVLERHANEMRVQGNPFPGGRESERGPCPLSGQARACLPATDNWTLNPQAENLRHQPLGGEYWLRQVAGKSREWIAVYLMGRYGCVADGRPVYPEYDDERHVARKSLVALPGVPLLLGWDFGLTPACVVAQLAPGGRLLVLAEFAGQETGIRRFAREVVAPALRTRFADLEVRSFGDPAGRARAQTDERTCMDELAAANIPTQPARSNDFTARREAVAGFLAGGEPDRPALLLSPACTLLRKGFLSGYRYERLPIVSGSGEERFAERPLKNMYSHIHDALQYAALAAEEPGRKPQARRRGRGTGRPADGMAGY